MLHITVCLKIKIVHVIITVITNFIYYPQKVDLVQQMLDAIIFSETCGATVQPAVHQKRTHYGAFQITLAHSRQQVLHIHDKNGHHP